MSLPWHGPCSAHCAVESTWLCLMQELKKDGVGPEDIKAALASVFEGGVLNMKRVEMVRDEENELVVGRGHGACGGREG